MGLLGAVTPLDEEQEEGKPHKSTRPAESTLACPEGKEEIKVATESPALQMKARPPFMKEMDEEESEQAQLFAIKAAARGSCASASSRSSSATTSPGPQDETLCEICMLPYEITGRVPVVTPCGHTFCVDCFGAFPARFFNLTVFALCLV